MLRHRYVLRVSSGNEATIRDVISRQRDRGEDAGRGTSSGDRRQEDSLVMQPRRLGAEKCIAGYAHGEFNTGRQAICKLASDVLYYILCT